MVSEGYREVLGKLPEHYWANMRKHLVPRCNDAIPCLLFGDECETLGSSYMTFTWMSELNPCKQDSWFSRHLITLIPSEHYVVENGKNVTLMCAMEEIIKSFEVLADGVSGQCLEITGIKGDWKFHKQIAFLCRHYGCNFCCHMCRATKSLQNPFADLHPQAGWRQTIDDPNDPPWDDPPALCRLRGFKPNWLLPDVLHVWFLGVGRDVCGSVICLLIRNRFWAGRLQKTRFRAATDAFKQFLRDNKLPPVPRKWKLDKKKINMKGGQATHLLAKAHHTSLVMRWLLHEVENKDCGNFHVHSLLWAANYSIGAMAAGSMFLSSHEGRQIKAMGEFFLREYLHLHHIESAAVASYKLFHLRPKWHLLHHVFLSCDPGDDAVVRNPYNGVCWMDEDMLKKVMSVTKKCQEDLGSQHAQQIPFGGEAKI